MKELFFNDNCEPTFHQIIATVTCVDDTVEFIFMDTVNFVVYPTNLDSFLIIENNECLASLEVVDECLDYIMIPPSPNITFGDSGVAVFPVVYLPDSTNECLIPYNIELPYDCPFCDLDNITIQGICDNYDPSLFNIYVSFTGDNLYDIVDTDGNVWQTGITSGTNIFVGAFPNLAEVTLIIRDNFVPNCEEAIYIECVICDPADCYSEAGTIGANTVNPCFGELVIADADDFLLMPKQSVWYLIHSLPIVNDTLLPDFNDDVYATGSFLFNDNGTIPCGTTGYITAFGAQEDPNLQGYPNYNDICMTISNTLPINMLCPIGISTDEICNVVTGDFTYTFILSGGMPQFFDENYFVQGNHFTGIVGPGVLTSVGPISDGETYVIIVTDSEGCTNSYEATIQCEKLPIELTFFEGKSTQKGNQLHWQTATETQNEYFTLLKSDNGNNFEEIAKISVCRKFYQLYKL